MNSNKPIATITKQKNQYFAVTTPTALDKITFNTMLNLFRSIEGSRWDSSKKVWVLPEEHYQYVIEKLDELDFEVKIRQYRPTVNIYEQDIYSVVETPWSPTLFQLLQSVPNAVWDDDLCVWKIPNGELSILIDNLYEADVQYTLSRVANQRKAYDEPDKKFKSRPKSIKPYLEDSNQKQNYISSPKF